ncbi:MAG: radical SAM protein [Bacteroidales bacterium]|nr:radical SAM protein [Bacteroidales bacterium]
MQTILFISDECNLRCRHCHVYNDTPHIKTYSQIEADLRYSYQLGARFVDFEGGEPFLWSDGNFTVNDLCILAKSIGFFSTTITTNAQMPFSHCKADSIWVSMDGLEEFHETIRGKGTFEKLLENLNACDHPHVSINMVINKLNYTNVEQTIHFAKNHPHIEKISLNFHTPYHGTEDLFIDDWNLRAQIIDKIISLKKSGFPVMNSISGLKLMKTNQFKKQCWVSNFILSDGSRYKECPGKTANICDKCGYCMAGEMHSVFAFKPDTLKAGFALRG